MGGARTPHDMAQGPSLITDNRIVGNARAGITAGAGSTVSGNLVAYNTVLSFSNGITVQCPSLVTNNTVVGQTLNVFTSGTGCVLEHNAIGP